MTREVQNCMVNLFCLLWKISLRLLKMRCFEQNGKKDGVMEADHHLSGDARLSHCYYGMLSQVVEH